LGDNAAILGHRLSELCGHGPSLETDIALTNISLDLFGQVRSYFQYAAELKGGDATEDTIAYSRFDRDFRNTILVEQPNTDFAYVIGRQFLFDAYHLPLLEQLINSKDETVAAIAAKSIKEVRYHLTFSSSWIKRLGDGTELSHNKMQAAIEELNPFTGELFEASESERAMQAEGIGADLAVVKTAWERKVREVMMEAGLNIPEVAMRQTGGKQGLHSEHMGFILTEFQFMQRAYPQMEW